MITQEQFDRGVAGTIIQGFVHKLTYQDLHREQTTGRPCRCFLGHTDDAPVGHWIAGTPRFWGSSVFARQNDVSADLEDFRDRMASFALEYSLDDSVCWMEVQQ